jgi:hypothetical protein
LTFEQVDEAHHHQGENDSKKYPRKVVNFPSTKRSQILADNKIKLPEQQRSQKMATVARNLRKKSITSNTEWEEKVEKWKKLLTCYKEEVLEYPRIIDSSSSGPQATLLNDTSVPLLVACKMCSLKAVFNNEPASRHMYKCEGQCAPDSRK